MTPEEHIKKILGDKDIQIALLRSQLDDAQAALAALERSGETKKDPIHVVPRQ